MTFSLTSPRRSHLLRSRWLQPTSPDEQTAAPSFPHGLIGDFLNLLNRPLSPSTTSLIPLSHFILLFSLDTFLSLIHSIAFHPRSGLFPPLELPAVLPNEGLVHPPDNRLAPCYLFFKLFAFRPSPLLLYWLS